VTALSASDVSIKASTDQRHRTGPVGGDAAAVIEVECLRKTYGPVVAVDDVSFAVAEGEIFGILGTNGAGKTTAVECIQGLRRPDSGRIRVLGVDATNRRHLAGLMGSQLQSSALPDRLRVQEAIDLFAAPGAIAMGELLESWGLGEHRRSAFGDLSGGLQQRVFIALALLNRPKVVFFDELTQGLDPLARRDVWQAITDVRNRGTTVVLVTHFMDEAEALCDRLAVFDHGRIVAAGTPAGIIASHPTTSTVSFTSTDTDLTALERCPGVTTVHRYADTVTVTGAPTMVAHVCAALVDNGQRPPADLRITQPRLEDAIVAIEGAHR
jgi:ABC-2 type transport system ATP-binding protein